MWGWGRLILGRWDWIGFGVWVTGLSAYGFPLRTCASFGRGGGRGCIGDIVCIGIMEDAMETTI